MPLTCRRLMTHFGIILQKEISRQIKVTNRKIKVCLKLLLHSCTIFLYEMTYGKYVVMVISNNARLIGQFTGKGFPTHMYFAFQFTV